jgi:hypothetical protein
MKYRNKSQNMIYIDMTYRIIPAWSGPIVYLAGINLTRRSSTDRGKNYAPPKEKQNKASKAKGVADHMSNEYYYYFVKDG